MSAGVYILLFSATVLTCVAVYHFVGKRNARHNYSFPAFDDKYED